MASFGLPFSLFRMNAICVKGSKVICELFMYFVYFMYSPIRKIAQLWGFHFSIFLIPLFLPLLLHLHLFIPSICEPAVTCAACGTFQQQGAFGL